MSDKPCLLIGLPFYREMPAQFIDRLFELIWPEKPLDYRYAIRTTSGDSLVPRARNEITAGFLQRRFGHLLFIDTDIEFESWHIQRLLSRDEPIRRAENCAPYQRA